MARIILTVIVVMILSGSVGATLSFLFLTRRSLDDRDSDFPVVALPFYVEPSFSPDATSVKSSTQISNADAFDQKIGPRSPDQEIASEFVSTFYSGGTVTVTGIAGKGSYWGSLQAATLRFPGEDDHLDVDFAGDAYECPGCEEVLQVRKDVAPEWKSHVVGKKIIITGQILRRYKPSNEQRERMWRRLYPDLKSDGNMTSYRGGYYTYSIRPTHIEVHSLDSVE